MAFTNDDILKLAGSVLAAGVIDTNTPAAWYEKRNANSFIIDPQTVWSDLPQMADLHAANFNEAVRNAIDNQNYFSMIGIDDDGSFNDDTAIRMTPVAGTNNATYIAYNTYNDPTSGVIKNWIQPQLLPRPNGAASAAYQATIWIGKPSEGRPLFTSAGSDGNWVSHFWNPAGGLLLISPNDAPPSATIPDTDLYVTGFVYAGAKGGGSFSGSSILLEDPDGQWRIRNDYPHLRFERREFERDGTAIWNSYGNIGHSIETDGLTLTRPYSITVNMNSDLNDHDENSELRSVFRLSGNENDFIYGNSQTQTVLETKRGTELVRAASLRDEVEVTNRPLKDFNIVLDSRIDAPTGSVSEISWVTDINYTPDLDFIRFNEILFDVINVEDADGNSPDDLSVPVRVSVETLDGELIQENISYTGLEAGVNGLFNLKKGEHFYPVEPKYTNSKNAITVFKLAIAKGYRLELSAGEYDFVDTTDGGVVKQQNIPYQKSKVEFLDHAKILDESNMRDVIHDNLGVILDYGVHTAFGTDLPVEQENTRHQLVGIGEHVLANRPVLGNYEDETYIATGTGGLFVLYQDDSTRTEFLNEPTYERNGAGQTPINFLSTTELLVDLEGVFLSEMNTVNWDVVNLERILPLLRYRNDDGDPVSYRIEISSKLAPDVRFQENMTKFDFENGIVLEDYHLLPTADPNNPEYVPLRLPRSTYTVNKESPRLVRIQFSSPVEIYGYWKDPTDPQDITTGEFIPAVKSRVVRVFEEPIVTGSDLDERVDAIEGQQEWAYATENNLATLHVVPSLQWLADKDGEALIFSTLEGLYSDRDQHQWIFETGIEAYYEPVLEDGEVTGRVFRPNPLVVHIPSDNVRGFQVSFGWAESFDLNDYDYAVFEFYIATHGRGMDSMVSINVPSYASVNYQFSRRRDGRYSYRATPYNENLSSTLSFDQNSNGDLEGTYPADPNPPIQT
ncbi:hypothetical protein [Vibrio phage RYC]|nr:hypothetical protein [Vibrio phage RYC]